MTGSPVLAAVQDQLQSHVLSGARDVVAWVRADAIADVDARLEIYADAYRLRLLEVLRSDYPVLLAHLGEEEFERFGRGYIQAYPSNTPSVRWFGRHLADYLSVADPRRPRLAELAAFEWTQGEVFDAPDSPVLKIEAIAALPPEAWPDMRLLVPSSVRRIDLYWNVPKIVSAHGSGKKMPRSEMADEATPWLLWRHRLDIHWRTLSTDEAAAFDAARDSASFGEICERLCEWVEPDDVAMHAAGLLKRWVADELISEIEQPNIR